MCRIAGMILKTKSAGNAETDIRRMTDVQAHGGPDGEGFYSAENGRVLFGHRRLSIIDIENGQQPMQTADRRLSITFNGEIYNYRQLKEELKQAGQLFETSSDTEVILKAYRQWGTQSFEKLEGMFAFALYDVEQKQVFLVRDANGIKPLYWAANDEMLAFASETRAIRLLAPFTGENSDWRILLLAFGHIPEPATKYKSILALPKGHFLQYDLPSNTFGIKKFKSFPYHPKKNMAQNEAHDELRHNLQQAVKNHLVADVPVGVFLSGGVDSSLVSLLAGQLHENDLKTLSIIFRETDFSERKYQLQIAAKTQVPHFEFQITYNDLARSFEEIIAGMDQPTTDGINTWFISKAAKTHQLKVVLSGLGGDELFGGYPSFQRMNILKNLRKMPSAWLRLTDMIDQNLNRSSYLSKKSILGDYLFLRGYFTPAKIASVLEITEKRVYDALRKISLQNEHSDYAGLDAGDKASYLEFNFYMQNQLLRDSDCMSMQHGVELRVPFLDQQLVNAALRYPTDIKYNGKPKSILTDTFHNLLPAGFTDRPKMGFSFPLQEWMRRIEPMRKMEHHNHKPLRELMKRFHRDELHWSKAFALFHVFNEA